MIQLPLCVFCWRRGMEAFAKRPIHTPALFVINGVSVCDMIAHMTAAEMDTIEEGMTLLRHTGGR